MVIELEGNKFACERYICGQRFDAEDVAIAHEENVLEHVAVIKDAHALTADLTRGGYLIGILEKTGLKPLPMPATTEAKAIEGAEKFRTFLIEVANIKFNG